MNNEIVKIKEDAEISSGMEIINRDVVLLSPGCASFGLFDNEFDRGNQFREIIKNL
jgi:UDP-N-acetylmuramoylalanine--D-glutamate ligase